MLLQLKSINVLNDCKIDDKSDNKSKKIRERLRELSQLMSNLRIVTIDWKKKWNALMIVFNNGIISSIYFDSNDHIISVQHDRYLVNKLLSEHIVNVILRDNYILISYTQSKLTLLSFNIKTHNNHKTKFRISNSNSNISSIELENGTTRRVERNLVVNDSGDLLIVWWKTGTNWVAPWSAPNKHLNDLANILVYSLTKSSFQLITVSCISGDIFQILFMKWNADKVVLLQQSSDSTYVLNYSIFEINESFESLQQMYSIRIPLLRPCLKAQFTSAQDKIVLLCDDDSIMLFNIEQNALYSLHSSVNAFDFSCNQFDAIFTVADQFGRISLYDYSLNTIPINYEELFNNKMLHLRQIKFIDATKLCLYFNEEKATNITLITFPVIFDNKTLISEYVKSGKCDEAIAALQCINWNCYRDIAYFSLNTIFNHLIKQPLNTIRESQIETTLATFLTPIIPIDEEICQEYKLEMHYLAKRFFYQLLRYNCLDKAFLLGVDLKSRQLFLLLHKIAREKGNDRIANASLLKSEQYNKQQFEQSYYPSHSALKINSCEQNNNNDIIVKKNSPPVVISVNTIGLPIISNKAQPFNEYKNYSKEEISIVDNCSQMPIASILKPSSSKSKASIIATKPVTFSTFNPSVFKNKQNIISESLTKESPESLYALSTKKKNHIKIENSSKSNITNNNNKSKTNALVSHQNSNEEIIVHSKSFKRSSFSSYSSSSCSSSSSSTFSSTSASTSLQSPTSPKPNLSRLSPIPPELPPRTYLMKYSMKPPERPPKKLISHNNDLETEELNEKYLLRNDCKDPSVPINLSHVKSGSKIECIHFGVV